MKLFLRFYIDLETEMSRGTSLDWLGVTREEAGIAEDAMFDSRGQEIIENEDGVWSVIPGLCGHELVSEDIQDAIEEIKNMDLPYGDFSQPWAIFEGCPVRRLVFGDGWAFKPVSVAHLGK